MRFVSYHLALIALALVPSTLVAQAGDRSDARIDSRIDARIDARIDSRIDSLFARWHTPDSPGAAVLVMRNGTVVHAKGYGMANLEHGVPIGPGTVFDIASVSKQFGAMAIALLEADGKLSLDDDVRKYVPELPNFGKPITIRHLVHHTSGIRDWPGTMRIGGWNFHDVISYEQILRFAEHQKELNFEPGEAYAYSNTGYNLLARVVERVSGQTFRRFTDERIFRPLGMNSTHFHDDHSEVVLRRAESYRRDAAGRAFIVPNNLTALGSSSLFTSIDDLARWVTNFDSARVGGRAVIDRMYQRGVLNKGDTIAYAFGQNVTFARGVRTVDHTGSWAGYRSVLRRYPDEGLAIVILANTADMNPAAMANRIADMLRAAPTTNATTTGATVATAAQTAPATPSPAQRTTRPVLTATELQAFSGTYTSNELLTSWAFAVKNGALVATHLRGGETVLQPTERDRFQSGVFGEVQFERDRSGRVTGFTANSDRVRKLRFTRSGA